MLRPSSLAVAALPLAKRVRVLNEPARRTAILAERGDLAATAAEPKLGDFIAMRTGRIAGIAP